MQLQNVKYDRSLETKSKAIVECFICFMIMNLREEKNSQNVKYDPSLTVILLSWISYFCCKVLIESSYINIDKDVTPS